MRGLKDSSARVQDPRCGQIRRKHMTTYTYGERACASKTQRVREQLNKSLRHHAKGRIQNLKHQRGVRCTLRLTPSSANSQQHLARPPSPRKEPAGSHDACATFLSAGNPRFPDTPNRLPQWEPERDGVTQAGRTHMGHGRPRGSNRCLRRRLQP